MSKATLVNEVENILRAQESAGWMVGDLMVRELGVNTSMAEDFIKNDLQPRLEVRGLDIEYERLRTYYRIALYNPPEDRNGVSFTAAEEAGQHPDRFAWYAKQGAKLSKREVRRLRGDRKLDTRTGGTLSQNKEMLSNLIKELEPAQLEEIMESEQVRARVSRAIRAVHSDMDHETRTGSRTRAPGLNQACDFANLMSHIDSMAGHLDTAVKIATGLRLGVEQQTEADEALGPITKQLEWLHSLVKTGLDAALEQMLQEGTI